MPVRTRSALTAAATTTLALAGACSDPTGVAAPAKAPVAQRDMEFNNPRHVFHTKEWFARQDAADGGQRYARPTGGSGTGIYYHNGSVLQGGTHVVAIYWNNPGYQNLPAGAGAGTKDLSLIGSFLNSLSALADTANRSYYNINHTYWGPGGSATTNLISPTVTYTAYWSTAGSAGAPTPAASPTDADMVALIQWGLDHGALTYDASAVYAIFTDNGVNLGGGFGSQYCAYHTHGTTTSGNVFFAAMPYNQQYPSGCTSQFASPNGDVAANSEVNTLAHEIEETTTDDMGNAWYDNRGYENADKCAWTWGATKTVPGGTGVYNLSGGGKYYLVQQNWVNANSGGCTTGY